MSVYVIDEIMGTGKTSAMINMINDAPPEDKFLFITPYLTEGTRIQESCPNKHFELPDDHDGATTKLADIKRLLHEDKNIASTHALFSHFDEDVIDLVTSKGYTLIIDETLCLIDKPKKVTPSDLEIIREQCLSIEEDGSVKWIAEDYDGRFNDIRKGVDNGMYRCYGGKTILWVLPPTVLQSFKDVYVMTYLFEHSTHRAWFDIHNISYEHRYISGDSTDNYCIVKEPQQKKKVDIRKLVHVCQNQKMNSIGDDRNALSVGWFKKNLKTQNIKKLSNNTYNFFRWVVGSKSKDNLWTTFIDYKDAVKGPGFSSVDAPKGCFLYCSARAMNEHRSKTALAYLVNRFVDTNIYNWLNQRGVKLDNDGFALSEMVQWIWRSAIRDGKEIWIYIPSRRMRTLLIDWMDSLAEGGDTDATM